MKTQSPSLLASFCRLVFANITKLKNKPTRSLVLFGLIAVATTGLASTASSAASLRQLILGLGLSHASGSAPQPKAALTNPVLTAPMPQLSSTMTVERRGHTATLLADGRALIVGGENGAGLINQSEIFDPSAGTFSVGGNLSSPRADHSATRLADGRVLVAGGRSTTGALNTTEIFDPTTGAFASGPAMSVARAGHSATLFADGRVLIAGGDANGSVEIFDPSTGNLSAVAANMNTARSMHSAALLADGRVLLVGGRTTAGDALSSGEIFDPSNSTFADAGSTKDTHVRAILRVLPDGKVQIIGGDVDHNAIEIYDPAAAIFGAHAHDIDPANDEHAGLIAELMSSPSRAALIHNGQTITELPGSNKALGAGGTDSSGNATSAATIYDSSPASVTTDVLDYPPGTPVIIAGRGFQANESVSLTFHEDPHVNSENPHVFTAQADASGNFVFDQYAPEEADLGVTYILGAKGQSSGWTAQTTFTDGVGLEIRESTCTTIQSTFTLGETVCARASGLGGNTYHIEWFSPANVLKNTSTDSTTGNLPDTYTPDSVGTWTVKVIRNSDSSVQKTQTFVVTATNAAPTDIALSNNSVAENAGANAVVGTLSGTDPDAGQSATLSFSLPAVDDNAAFNISGNSLRANASFDFESDNSYTVTVRATDTGGLTYDEQFTISVTDVNETPTDIALSNNSVAENAGANAVVGTLSGTDPDAGQSATLSFSLPAVDDNAAFNISGNSLRANASFDFESDNSYTVTVRATDTGGLTYDEQFTISVTDVNETPTDIALSNNSVAENAGANAVVGTLSGTDPDAGQSATLSFSLPAVDDNAAFNISGNSLRANASFDFESDNSYTVTVRATDTGGLTYDEQFTISVIDVNDAPTLVIQNVQINGVLQGALPASIVQGQTLTFDAVGSDVDVPANILTYSLANGSTGVPAGAAINSATGAFSWTPPLLQIGTFNFKVVVTDNGTPNLSAQYSITITVFYNFVGFFQPIDNLPIVNKAQAGSAIPVKFSLGGNQGLNIFMVGYPVSGMYPCNTSDVSVDIEQTVNAGGSSLTYDPVANQYVYVWKTEKSWANSCRQLVVKFADGTDKRANFQFKK